MMMMNDDDDDDDDDHHQNYNKDYNNTIRCNFMMDSLCLDLTKHAYSHGNGVILERQMKQHTHWQVQSHGSRGMAQLKFSQR